MNFAGKAIYQMKTRLLKSNKIYVGKSDTHGYGVFASEDISKNEVLEDCYYIEPKETLWNNIDDVFKGYFFNAPYLQENALEFASENGGVLLDHITRPICVLGYGMIFNHSKTPNVECKINQISNIISFISNRRIKAGEELFIQYNNQIDYKNAK